MGEGQRDKACSLLRKLLSCRICTWASKDTKRNEGCVKWECTGRGGLPGPPPVLEDVMMYEVGGVMRSSPALSSHESA